MEWCCPLSLAVFLSFTSLSWIVLHRGPDVQSEWLTSNLLSISMPKQQLNLLRFLDDSLHVYKERYTNPASCSSLHILPKNSRPTAITPEPVQAPSQESPHEQSQPSQEHHRHNMPKSYFQCIPSQILSLFAQPSLPCTSPFAPLWLRLVCHLLRAA